MAARGGSEELSVKEQQVDLWEENLAQLQATAQQALTQAEQARAAAAAQAPAAEPVLLTRANRSGPPTPPPRPVSSPAKAPPGGPHNRTHSRAKLKVQVDFESDHNF